jgi:DNA-binding transcriptional MerR regulator
MAMAEKLIGEIAREFGLNPRTLRYCEALSLLPAPKRSRGGYRLYSNETEARLAFIAKSKSLGLTLREIQQVISAANGGKAPCDSVEATPR